MFFNKWYSDTKAVFFYFFRMWTIMCLGIPMQIKRIEGFNAYCVAKGVGREVSLFMLQDESLAVGDFVVVHVGYAIERISEEQAQTAWELYDQMLAG
jgi:hydrogenase expression/formation protein HypC